MPKIFLFADAATTPHLHCPLRMVGVLGPLFRTAGHTVRTHHGVTASAGHRRGDVDIRSYLQDAAGHRSLVFDLSMTHDRFWEQ